LALRILFLRLRAKTRWPRQHLEETAMQAKTAALGYELIAADLERQDSCCSQP